MKEMRNTLDASPLLERWENLGPVEFNEPIDNYMNSTTHSYMEDCGTNWCRQCFVLESGFTKDGPCMLVGEDFIYEHFYVNDVKLGYGREIRSNYTYAG
jgi:hypothetical protein